MRRFALHWGELEVFAANETVPAALRPITEALVHLEDRFRPALLRPRLRPEAPYVAVWPANQPTPDLTENAIPDPHALEEVVLAEIHSLTCHACTARFRAVYPDTGLPIFGRHIGAHQLINGCPRCGSDFAASRIQALTVLPLT
ncbi:hypothetical protein AB0D92_33305 [Streptomyces parvus]|uniref:hypothetical protein n=1 Tax=Streptomyces parvus TaxID=66428 RepID=UPI003408D83B